MGFYCWSEKATLFNLEVYVFPEILINFVNYMWFHRNHLSFDFTKNCSNMVSKEFCFRQVRSCCSRCCCSAGCHRRRPSGRDSNLPGRCSCCPIRKTFEESADRQGCAAIRFKTFILT